MKINQLTVKNTPELRQALDGVQIEYSIVQDGWGILMEYNDAEDLLHVGIAIGRELEKGKRKENERRNHKIALLKDNEDSYHRGS